MRMNLVYSVFMSFSRIYVTLFGAGYLPKAPGTWGTLVSLPILWFLKGAAYEYFIFCGCFIFSWALTRHYLIQFNKIAEDPSEVVIDEFLGMWVTLLFVPKTYLNFLLGFLLFRIFDMWKPWPISWADQIKGSATKTSFGIILDDIFAGLIAAGFLLIFDSL